MIYVASKVKHAPTWQGLRNNGVRINSTWIDEAGPDESPDLSDLWCRCVNEAATADALLLYVEPGEVLKGALVEVGVALSSGKPVYVVGDGDGSWVNHPRVVKCSTVQQALHFHHHHFILGRGT